jgi:hypothetical protein
VLKVAKKKGSTVQEATRLAKGGKETRIWLKPTDA